MADWLHQVVGLSGRCVCPSAVPMGSVLPHLQFGLCRYHPTIYIQSQLWQRHPGALSGLRFLTLRQCYK